MSANVEKFVKLGVTRDSATLLVAAELVTPKIIKATSEEDLIEVLGSEQAAIVMALFGMGQE